MTDKNYDGARAKGLEAVLFDLDGVIIDSESVYTEFWAGIDRRFPTGVDDFAMAIKGTNLTHILGFFPDDAVRDSVLAAIHDFELTVEFALYPGAAELMAGLRAAGVKTAIVTSSDRVKMECLYRGHPELETAVDVVIDGSMVSRSKPDPQGYLMAAERLGADPRRAVVVEDSLQGIEAGRRAGAAVAGIATTYPRHALEGKATVVADTISDLTVAMLANLVAV